LIRQIVQDFAILEDSKIIQDDDKFLVVKAVIASEIVHKYKDGMAYKPADELEKAAWTAEGRWVKALSHPASDYIRNVNDINGRMENPRFRKDLNDPKTNRPCRRGIEVDIRFFKDRTGKEVLDKIKSGQLKDNSIGFSCDKDGTPGEFQGQKYDYVQRNICIDHLAAPIEKGRCPSPYCGINADSVEDLEKPVITVQDDDLGVSYVFDKAKFTDEQAKVWVEKRSVKDCPVCTRMLEAGLLTAGQRLYKQYGADVLEVIEGHELPPKDASPQPPATTDTQDSKDDVIQKNRLALKDLYSLTEIFT
jgi:hypothetical protein